MCLLSGATSSLPYFTLFYPMFTLFYPISNPSRGGSHSPKCNLEHVLQGFLAKRLPTQPPRNPTFTRFTRFVPDLYLIFTRWSRRLLSIVQHSANGVSKCCTTLRHSSVQVLYNTPPLECPSVVQHSAEYHWMSVVQHSAKAIRKPPAKCCTTLIKSSAECCTTLSNPSAKCCTTLADGCSASVVQHLGNHENSSVFQHLYSLPSVVQHS